MFGSSKRHFVAIASAASSVALVAMALSVSLGGVASAHASGPSDDVLTASNARFETGGQTGVQLTPNWQTTFGTSGKVSPSQYTTIPAFQSSFSYQGTTYPFQMVGRDPSHPGTTHVRTVLIPINLTFACSGVTRSHGEPVGGLPGGCATSGEQLLGSTQVQGTLNSPIFSNATYPLTGDTTQYADEIQRAEFWTQIKNNYHVLLDQPQVMSTVNWTIPNTQGFESTSPVTGIHRGFVSIDWWYPQLLNLISALNLSPQTFPIFLTKDTVLWQGDPANCCIIGYHDSVAPTTAPPNGKLALYTYSWASWTTSGFFTAPGIADINALSHEVAEWVNDPFTDNAVPPWLTPSAPQYGCTGALEVGDPLVGVTFPVTVNGYTYHPQDETFYSWFARQSPSVAINGRYTYLGTFSTYSSGC